MTTRQYMLMTAALRVCSRYSASLTSWIRTAAHNQAVGGAENSKHLRGYAIDVHYDGPPPDISTVLAACGSSIFRIRREQHPTHPEKDHDHIEILDDGMAP